MNMRWVVVAIALSLGMSMRTADAEPKSLAIATASPGGLYYVYGELIARVLTQELGLPVNAMPTQGSVHNIQLLDLGHAQLGLITMGVGLQGWNGSGDWTKGKKYQQMRALFPAYDNTFQFVALRRSGLSRVVDLDGKRAGIGPRAGTAAVYIPEIMKALGVSAHYTNGAWEANGADLLAGQLDGVLAGIGVPFPALQEVEAKEPVTFLSLSPEEIARVRAMLPEITPSKISRGTYRALASDYDTIGLFNFAIGRPDLPGELVYRLVKAVHEKQKDLVAGLPSAAETVAQNVDKNTFLPFHPGAVRYYREIGIKIPDSLVPQK
jgi:TRAP transporter TAXI family solute receptor